MTTCKTLVPFLLPKRSLFSPPKPKSNSTSKLGLRFTSLVAAAAALTDPNPTGPTPSQDIVEKLLTKDYQVNKLMKMERKTTPNSDRWFPYIDTYKASESLELKSSEIIEALGPYIMEERKERIKKAVENRSYSVCLVVEGLTDFGNVSAAFRSADALGVQSVHVISADSKKRYKDNRHVSMGAEKWLDIEMWKTPLECFEVLRNRGYRIATTHLGMATVSIHDLDWSCPTAIVVGNEKM